MNKKYRKKLYKKYSNMGLGLLLIIALALLMLKSCHKDQAYKVNNTKADYIKKEKIYIDSIVKLNKKLSDVNVKKDTVYKKYTEYKTKIVVQKEQLINKQIDTITILETYDLALSQCDSLNNINDTIIETQLSKINILDSVISNEKNYNKKLSVDLSLLNSQIKKNKVKYTGRTIMWSIISGSIGFGAGVVTGIFK
jgi:hypothetical protein